MILPAKGTDAVNITGVTLHYIEKGKGTPIICVHGSLGDYRSFGAQMDGLSDNHRVIAYSRRYHWPNMFPVDKVHYSATDHAADLIEFIRCLRLPPVHIVSASYGSYTALIAAMQCPSIVRSLTVVEPPIMGWLAELEGGLELADDFEENTMKPAREFFVKNKDAMAIRAFIDGVVGSTGAFDRFRPEIRSALMNNAREMKAEALSDKLMPKFNEVEAQQISTPVLLLLGSNSPPMFRRIVEALAGSLPNCRLSTIAGASHNLNASRPRVYNDLVLEFIREVEAL